MGEFGLTERSNDPLPPATFDAVIAVGASNYQLADGDGHPIPNPRELLSPISNRGPWVSVVAPEDVQVLCGAPHARLRAAVHLRAGPRLLLRLDRRPLRLRLVAGDADRQRPGVAPSWAATPELSPTQVRSVIDRSADKIGETAYVDGRNDFYGYGRVNALRALQLAGTLARVDAGASRSPSATARISCLWRCAPAADGRTC